MKPSEEIYEQIERYLAHEMSEEEQASFEQNLKADPRLRAEVKLHQELAETLAEDQVIRFSQMLEQVDRQQFPETTAERPVRPLWQSGTYRYIGIPATIALLIGLYFFFQPNTSQTPEALFAAHYEKPRMRLTVRGEGAETRIQQANTAYQQQDFAAAITHLQQLQAIDSGKLEYLYYEGIARLNLYQAEEAVQIFDRLLSHPEADRFRQEAQWYRGLALLRNSDIPAARTALQAIAEDAQHYYSQAAREVLASSVFGP